jgi:hypothetical protein
VQNAETWATNTARRPAPAGGPAALHGSTLGESEAGQGKVRAQGLPQSADEASSGQEAGERGGRTLERMIMRVGQGRPFSRQVQSSQCNGFLHEKSLCRASQRSTGRGWREGRAEARAWSSSWHPEPGQAGPEGRVGHSSLYGDQQRALRQVEDVERPLRAVSKQPEASSSCLLGCTPLREIR